MRARALVALLWCVERTMTRHAPSGASLVRTLRRALWDAYRATRATRPTLVERARRVVRR